jgi:hypothetical protein
MPWVILVSFRGCIYGGVMTAVSDYPPVLLRDRYPAMRNSMTLASVRLSVDSVIEGLISCYEEN